MLFWFVSRSRWSVLAGLKNLRLPHGFGAFADLSSCPLSPELSGRVLQGHRSGRTFVQAVQNSIGASTVEYMARLGGADAGPLLWRTLETRFDCLKQMIALRCGGGK